MCCVLAFRTEIQTGKKTLLEDLVDMYHLLIIAFNITNHKTVLSLLRSFLAVLFISSVIF